MQRCKTFVCATIAWSYEVWHGVGLSFTGVPSESNLKVMSRSNWQKTVTMTTYILQNCSNFFCFFWWHLYQFSRITSIYINLTLCRWAISDNLKTDQNFIIVISINLIGFRPIGYTFTSLHVAIMSPSISSVNKTVSSNSGPHLIIIYRPTVDRCIV